jgi:superfamily I DNA and/or RNA helicase
MLSSHLHPIVYAYKKYSDYLTERKQQKRSKRGDVIGMTLHASVVNLGLRNAAFRPQIVLVDEAGQIPMPYASIIGSFGCGSVIFIGDDKQMPPIFHPNLVGDKFSKSIFKYLCDKYPQLRKTLNVTYRMNDEITELVSGLFYDTSSEHIIKSSESASKRRTDYSSLTGVQDGFYKNLLSSNESIIFADVNPSTESTSEDSNIYEATACAELAKIFDANGIKSDDYAIITPYRRQVKLIKSLIGSDNSPLVDTVECLQGQDVNTIIISFVAVSPAYVREQIDFLLNQNRLNVMISRAKTKVIVFMSKLLQYELFRRFKIDANSYSGLKIISSEF